MNKTLCALAIFASASIGHAAGKTPVMKLTTGVQAAVSFRWTTKNYQNNSSTYSADKVGSLSYKDKTGYFGGAKQISAWVGYDILDMIHGEGQVARKPTSQVVTMTLGKNGTYRGALTQHLSGYVADSDQDIANVRGAFTNGSKWDSNLGANYDLKLGTGL